MKLRPLMYVRCKLNALQERLVYGGHWDGHVLGPQSAQRDGDPLRCHYCRRRLV